jgi:hypothetical protein
MGEGSAMELKLEAFGSDDHCYELQFFQRLFVINTNLMFAIVIYALLEKPRLKMWEVWPELCQAWAILIFSSFYHWCDDADGTTPCFRVCVLYYRNLHTFDFIFSHQLIAICLFCNMKLLFKSIFTLVWFAINVANFGYINMDYNAFVAGQVSAGVVIYLLRFIWRADFQNHPRALMASDIKASLDFVPWALLGLLCKIVGNVIFYDLFHGLWHVCEAYALYKFVQRIVL